MTQVFTFGISKTPFIWIKSSTIARRRNERKAKQLLFETFYRLTRGLADICVDRLRRDTLYIVRIIYANRQIRKMATKVFRAYNARSTMENSIHTCAIMHVTMAVKQLLSPIPHNRRVGKLQCSRLVQHFRAWLVKEREYVSNPAQLFPDTVSPAVPSSARRNFPSFPRSAKSREVVANGTNYFLPVTYSRTNKLRSRRVVARQIAVIRERASFLFRSKFTVSLFSTGSTRSLQADSRKGRELGGKIVFAGWV